MAIQKWRPSRGLIPWNPFTELNEMERRMSDIYGGIKLKKTTLIMIVILSLFLLSMVSGGCSNSNGALHVLVLGPDNNPVSGAKVVSNIQPDGQLKVTGLTSADGTVTYNNIRAGNYEFYISSQYQQKEFEVNVVAGQTTNITITLEER